MASGKRYFSQAEALKAKEEIRDAKFHLGFLFYLTIKILQIQINLIFLVESFNFGLET